MAGHLEVSPAHGNSQAVTWTINLTDYFTFEGDHYDFTLITSSEMFNTNIDQEIVGWQLELREEVNPDYLPIHDGYEKKEFRYMLRIRAMSEDSLPKKFVVTCGLRSSGDYRGFGSTTITSTGGEWDTISLWRFGFQSLCNRLPCVLQCEIRRVGMECAEEVNEKEKQENVEGGSKGQSNDEEKKTSSRKATHPDTQKFQK